MRQMTAKNKASTRLDYLDLAENMANTTAQKAEKAEAELLRTRLNYLDLVESSAHALVSAAERETSNALLNGLELIKQAGKAQDALKAAHKALANVEEKASAQKQSISSGSLLAKAATQKNGPAFFTAKPEKADMKHETIPAPSFGNSIAQE